MKRGKARYRLAPPTALAPWSDAIAGAWEQRFGAERPTTALILRALSGGRAPNTYASYSTGWGAFTRFAAAQGLDPLAATERDVCHHMADMAQGGTVAMASFRPYLSSINAVFDDLGVGPGPARGPLVKRVREGLRRMQVDTQPRETELALPAKVAKSMHNEALTRAASRAPPLALLRALLYATMTFLTASRSVSTAALPKGNVMLDPSAEYGLIITRKFTKTAQGHADVGLGRVPLQFPTARFKDLLSALSQFARWRDSVLPTANYFFQLPGDHFPNDPTAAGSLADGWLTTALAAFDHKPPAGAQWTPRSLRSGAASAAEAAGVPRSKTEYLGGWAPGSSSLTEFYIDPAYAHSPEGEFFFGHLTARV